MDDERAAVHQALAAGETADDPLVGYRADGPQLASVIASDRIIKERPEAVRHFVKAFLKSMQFFIDNPEQAGKDLHEVAPETEADVNIAEIIATIPLIKNEISAKYGMGTFDPELVKQSWVWVAKSQGLALNKVDPDKVVDRSFLPKP